MSDEITISLTKYEAVILMEFVANLNESNTVTDKADQRVLWDLECLLEKAIPEIVGDQYGELLAEARKSLQE